MDRDEEEGPGGSVHCLLPQESELGGDWALSPPDRSHFILHSWAMQARRCLSSTSSSGTQVWDSVSCRNSQRPFRDRA